jgi:hypothetical protein
MRRIIVAVLATVAIAFGGSSALAASNPSGSGQPGASCGSAGATSMPAGFATGGFATAEGNYAGSEGTHSLVSNNAHAVSQYDVACYQVTSAGH